MKQSAIKNKQYIQKGIKHHLYYDFNILDMMEDAVNSSLINIQHFKRNYLDDEAREEASGKSIRDMSPRKRTKSNLLGKFKMLMKIPEKEEIEAKKEEMTALHVSKLPEIDIGLKASVDKLVNGTPFEKLMLLDLKNTQLRVEPAEFRKNQTKFYKQDAENKSAQFMVEFNELVNTLGDNPEVMRDMNFFLIKEVSKSYVFLQVLMREFYSLNKVKEYINSELTVQAVEVALLRKELHKATGGAYIIDPKELQKQIKGFENIIGSLEMDNQRLRTGIVDLNQKIKVGDN